MREDQQRARVSLAKRWVGWWVFLITIYSVGIIVYIIGMATADDPDLVNVVILLVQIALMGLFIWRLSLNWARYKAVKSELGRVSGG